MYNGKKKLAHNRHANIDTHSVPIDKREKVLSLNVSSNGKIKLYYGHTYREEYRGYKDVLMVWLSEKRDGPIAPYNEVIKNYEYLSEDERRRAEEKVDEMLTWKEALRLKTFLKKNFDWDMEICEQKIPVSSNEMSFTEYLGRGGRQYSMTIKPDYSEELSFMPWAFIA